MADVDGKATKTKAEKKAEAKKTAEKNAKKPAAKSPGFFKSTMTELKKVHWPDKEKVVKYTGVVFGIVIVLGAIIWALDTGFSAAIGLIMG